MTELEVFFQLRYREMIDDQPRTENDVRVIAIGFKTTGPYFIFNEKDRFPDKHLYYGGLFKRQAGEFKTLRSLKVKLCGPTLRTYYDMVKQMFWFGNPPRYLQEVYFIQPSYPGESKLNLTNYQLRCDYCY